MIDIIIGPPGTGKTHTLLEIVDDYFKGGGQPERVAFFSHTKKAANEAKERAYGKFDLDPGRLKYFRTLHSFSFNLLGLNGSAVLNRQRLLEFAEIMNLDIQGRFATADGQWQPKTEDDELFRIVQSAGIRQIPVLQQWEEEGEEGNWWALDRFARGLEKFKEVRHLYDFTDMIVSAAGIDPFPQFDVVIIDEAQDLSRAQWTLVDKLTKSSDKTYVAGDDDQSIFGWAGADTDYFINLEGNVRVLDQSYRVPRKVQDFANNIIGRVSERRDKAWKPTEEEGDVHFRPSFDTIDMSEGSWLLLSRVGWPLYEFKQYCHDRSYFYDYDKDPPITEGVLDAVLVWEAMRRGETVQAAAAERAVRFLPPGFVPRFAPDSDLVTMAQLNPPTTAIWHEALTGIAQTEREYMISMLRRGEKLGREPRIKISTIHGAKGGQADNVVLLQDVGKTCDPDKDEEHRVFYVGATRTKQTLFVIEPQTRYTYNC